MARSTRKESDVLDGAHVTIFSSAFGWMAVAWKGVSLTRISFGQSTPQQALAVLGASEPHPPPRLIQGIVRRLQRFSEGDRVDFSSVQLDLSHLTAFQQRVIQQCRAIPYGTTLNYGELARQAGSPRAARAVGNVMATNRFPLVVPCHRVVAANGALGGYSAPNGLAIKVRLLRNENAW